MLNKVIFLRLKLFLYIYLCCLQYKILLLENLFIKSCFFYKLKLLTSFLLLSLF